MINKLEEIYENYLNKIYEDIYEVYQEEGDEYEN